MSVLHRTDGQWQAIDRAILAGPDHLTADMYQNAVVAQVETDIPSLWPLGSIEHQPPVRYMVKGLFEEYIETFKRDEINPDYHRMARLILPSHTPYPHDEPDSLRRNIKEYGDISWYLVNILASHHISLADILPGSEGCDVPLKNVDELAQVDAKTSGGLAWHLPGHNYVFHATELLEAVIEMGRPLAEGGVEQFFKRRDNLGKRASNLLLAISVVLQAKFDSSLAGALHQNLAKVEGRACTGTTLFAAGDDRELRLA